MLRDYQFPCKLFVTGKGVAPSPTPPCSSYRKGSLWVTLDSTRQLYFLLLNQFIPLLYIFTDLLHLGFKVCLPLHKFSERKENSKVDTS